MYALLVKRFSSFLHYHHLALPISLLQRYLSTQTQPQNEFPFVASYLVSSFGFSPDRALKLSADAHFTAVKSSERLDSVVQFLRDTGLSDTQIKAVASSYPFLLTSNVEKTLKPKVRELIERGFSGEVLIQLIRYNPSALLLKDTLSRLLFWREFVGKSNVALLKIIRRNSSLLIRDIDKQIVPKMNLFKEYGLSDRDIVWLLERVSRAMSLNLDSMRQVLELIEELGLHRGSSMFLQGFRMLGGSNKDEIKRKIEFYKMTYGWSQEDVYSAFRKFPSTLVYSKEKIKSNMDFLIREAKLEPRSIASQSVLLGYSVKKRLVPRHHVLTILAVKGLKESSSLLSACVCSEKKFLAKYVEPYKKDVPDLADAYFAAGDQNFTLKDNVSQLAQSNSNEMPN